MDNSAMEDTSTENGSVDLDPNPFDSSPLFSPIELHDEDFPLESAPAREEDSEISSQPEQPPIFTDSPIPNPASIQPSVSQLHPEEPEWEEKYSSDSDFLSDIFSEYSESSLATEERKVIMLGRIIDESPEIIQPFSEIAMESCLRMDHLSVSYLPRYLRKYFAEGELSFKQLHQRYQNLSAAEKGLVKHAIYIPDSNIDSESAISVARDIRKLAHKMIEDKDYLDAFHTFQQTII